jgi:hypothetical protein
VQPKRELKRLILDFRCKDFGFKEKRVPGFIHGNNSKSKFLASKITAEFRSQQSEFRSKTGFLPSFET